MDIRKLSFILIVAGVSLSVVSVVWWLLFHAQVVQSLGARLSDLLPCLWSSSGSCTLISAGASFMGKTAYTPTIFWIAIGSLLGGVVLNMSGASTSNSESDAVGAEPSAALRKCPFCAETVKAEAKICRYCKSELPELSEPEKTAVLFGKCPNCETVLPITTTECPNCKASFAAGSSWSLQRDQKN